MAVAITCKRDTLEGVAKEDSKNDFGDLCEGISVFIYMCMVL